MRWNKLPRTLWTSGGMLKVEPPPLTLSTLYLYLRTCDRPTRIAGLLRGAATICDDTGWDAEGVREGVRKLSDRGLLITSERPAYILVPESLAFDLPDPGNATKGALTELGELPQVEPVTTARSIIQARKWSPLAEGVSKGVPEGVQRGLPSQEQEQRAGSGAEKKTAAAGVREWKQEPMDRIADLRQRLGAPAVVRGDQQIKWLGIASLPIEAVDELAAFAIAKGAYPVSTFLGCFYEDGQTITAQKPKPKGTPKSQRGQRAVYSDSTWSRDPTAEGIAAFERLAAEQENR